MRRKGWLGLLAALAILAVARPAAALSGVTVAPAIQDIRLQTNEPSHDFVLSVTNNDRQTKSVKLSALDFGSLDESGGLTFIGQHADPNQLKYSLTSWLSFDNANLTLAPGETKKATVTIENKQSLAPGGHYAAVVVTPVNEDGTPVSGRVQLVPSASVLLLVRKEGGDVSSLKVASVTAGHGWFHLPSTATVRLRNDGNVHLVPRGTVTLSDSAGRQLAKGIVNSDSGFILPETYRQYPVELQKSASAWWPGQYTLTATTRYDGTSQTVKTVVKFYYLGAWLYLFLGILCIALICFVVLKTLKRRKVIHKAEKPTA